MTCGKQILGLLTPPALMTKTLLSYPNKKWRPSVNVIFKFPSPIEKCFVMAAERLLGGASHANHQINKWRQSYSVRFAPTHLTRWKAFIKCWCKSDDQWSSSVASIPARPSLKANAAQKISRKKRRSLSNYLAQDWEQQTVRTNSVRLVTESIALWITILRSLTP